MATMRFLLRLQEYLRKNGTIYTVRKYLYNPDIYLVFVPEVGACRREFIDTVGVTRNKLLPYCNQSGFETVDDWWDKIMDINPTTPTIHLYLYRVTLIRSL